MIIRKAWTYFPLFFILLSTLLLHPRSYSQAQANPVEISNINRILGIVMANLIILSYFVYRKKIRRNLPLPLKIFLLYILCGILSTAFFSTWLEYSSWKLLEISTIVFYGIYLWNLRDQRSLQDAYNLNIKFYKFLLLVVGINLILLSSESVVYIKGAALFPFRIRSEIPTIDATQIGLLAAIILFTTTIRIGYTQGVRLKHIFWWFFSLTLLLFSQARSAWIGIILAFFVYFLYSKERRTVFKIVILLPLLWISYILGPYLLLFFSRGQGSHVFFTLSNRTVVWNLALVAYENLPFIAKILGGGFASMNREVGLLVSQSGMVSTVDNEFLNALLSCGLIGMVSIFAVYFLLLKNVLTHKSKMFHEAAGVIILLCVRAFFNTHIALYSIFSPIFPVFIVLLYLRTGGTKDNER